RVLQTDLGAGNVVAPVPVERAVFHLLNRFSLHRHVGSLPPSDRDQSRRRTEEKTFHHLHLNLHLLSWEGSVSVGRCSPWKVPLAPLTSRPFRYLRCPLSNGLTGRSDMGMPPSVAGPH